MLQLVIAIWHVLAAKVAHRDLGADNFALHSPERAMGHVDKHECPRHDRPLLPDPSLTPNGAHLSRQPRARFIFVTEIARRGFSRSPSHVKPPTADELR